MSNRKPHETLAELPTILVTTDEARRLGALADSSRRLFPHVVHFLERELDRARVVPDDADLRGVVRMGSHVRFRDDRTGQVRDVVLVYPHEANVAAQRISVLTPVGAALIGMSTGQTIEFQTPDGQTRSLTVQGVVD